MSAIVVNVNGHNYPPLERGFTKNNLANTTDVVALDNTLYTDFDNNTYNQWSFTYESLTKAQYDVIRADYDAQFTALEYPLVSIPFYEMTDVPCRMIINEQVIYNHCGDVEGVEIIFRETAQLPEVS